MFRAIVKGFKLILGKKEERAEERLPVPSRIMLRSVHPLFQGSKRKGRMMRRMV